MRNTQVRRQVLVVDLLCFVRVLFDELQIALFGGFVQDIQKSFLHNDIGFFYHYGVKLNQFGDFLKQFYLLALVITNISLSSSALMLYLAGF